MEPLNLPSEALSYHPSLSYISLDDLKSFPETSYFSISVEILAEFARTRHLTVTPVTAVQLFIAADALDVEGARCAFIL